MKHPSQFNTNTEQKYAHSFHSDLNELIENLILIYKTREGVASPKFGFCKEMISTGNRITKPITLCLEKNESGITKQ